MLAIARGMMGSRIFAARRAIASPAPAMINELSDVLADCAMRAYDSAGGSDGGAGA